MAPDPNADRVLAGLASRVDNKAVCWGLKPSANIGLGIASVLPQVARLFQGSRRRGLLDVSKWAAACPNGFLEGEQGMDPARKHHPWYAVQVRARSEKLVGCILRNKGFETLLPLYTVRRRRADRTVDLDLPLFPGYLFCRLNLSSRLLPLFTTPGVVRLVGAGSTPAPVDESEIEAIQTILKDGRAPMPCPIPKEGERVMIGDGPLAGVEGVLVGQKKNSRLVVSVTLLQRAVSVEVDSDSALPISRAAQPVLRSAVSA
jgi:transcription antitermination factor NusG